MPKKLKDPWKKLFANIMLSATYGSAGARGETNPKFSGRAFHKNAASSSQSTRRHKVEVDPNYLKDIFAAQGGKCYWFGIKLNPMDVFVPRYPLAMSVDRINNELGYIKDNIIICCRLANLGRQNCTEETYRQIIKIIKKSLPKRRRKK